MKRIILFFLLILFFGLTACSNADENEQPRPTPLPTAVPPAGENDTFGSWAITFGYDFPDAFWPEGVHRYAYNIECPPELTQLKFSSSWNMFEVSETNGFSPDPVYLRLNGLSLDPFTPIILPEARFNPQQSTTAIIHFLGLSEQVAEQAGDECEAFIAWDEFPPQPLTPIEIFQP